MARNTELEEVIFAAPDDPSGYLVYADWLQAQGDPRGELIVRQHRDVADAQPFLDEHAEAFLGRFARATPETFELEWRWGFIRTANIGWELFAGEAEDDPSDEQLAAFLALDSARFLQELSIGPTPEEDQLSFDACAETIAQAAPRALRTLDLGDIDNWDISSTSTALPACASVPALRDVTLTGGSVTLGPIDLPELRTFRVHSGSLTKQELHDIATARWPQLEELDIWFGDPNYGATGTVDDVAPILAGTGLGKLRILRLRNCPFADELVARLVDAPIVAQVHTLDLSMGNLSDRGVALMLAARRAFHHLEQLELDDNALTNASWPAARELAKNVVFGNRHSPDRAVPRDASVSRYARYVAVGE